MGDDNTQGGAEPSPASDGSQLEAVRAKLLECDREAALRGWPDTGWPRLWFSALSRAAGLDLRQTQPSIAGPGLGCSIRPPAVRDSPTPAMLEFAEKMRLTDEEHLALCKARDAYAANSDDEECVEIAAAIRGLLERLG